MGSNMRTAESSSLDTGNVAPAVPSALSASQAEQRPQAIAVNNSVTTIDGQSDPILTNIATGVRARWSTKRNEEAAPRKPSRLRLQRISKQCLPRGGTYLSTVIGPIQVGIPPETIKDSMALGLPVPQYFVVPPEKFCRTLGNSLGVNVAEFEFPAYYNFFLKGNTVKLIVDSVDTEIRIRALMQETLLGPKNVDASVDFHESVPVENRPDIGKELSYFRAFNGKELSIDLLITFIHQNSDGIVILDGVDGTPGADWCISIAVSNADGGQYIFTEHQKGGSDPSHENAARLSADDSESMVSEEDVWEEENPMPNAIDVRTAGDTNDTLRPTSLRHESIAKHMSVHLTEGDSEDENTDECSKKGNFSSRGSKESPIIREENRQGEDERGGTRNGREGEGRGIERGQGAESQPKHAPIRQVGDSSSKGKNQDSTSSDEAPDRRHFTPTRPSFKPSFGNQRSEVGRPLGSVANWFGRWLVHAHIGENKSRSADDGSIDRDGRISRVKSAEVEANTQLEPPPAAGNNVSKAGRESRNAKRTPRRIWAPGLNGWVRTGIPSLNGFLPVRTGEVSMTCPLPTKLPSQPEQTEDEFIAPTFGTTVLGNSHGFDPNGSTSGYVLWINGRGYMIDPPPYASMILQASNIRPSLIAGVIVTHCHADHDAGTFQKVLLDGQVNIISTRTIYESFIRKYTALSGMSGDLIRYSHKFIPVKIGQTLRLNGACFDFFYTLHSIPCVGFEVTFKGKGMVFSADHMNDPGRIREMCEQGFLSEGRRDALLDFPWHHDLIYHEAGIPPIHTPIQTLEGLADDLKKRVFVVHVSESSIPKDSGLKVAPAGVKNTMRLDTIANIHEEALDVLDLICSVGILSGVSVAQARSLLEVARQVRFEANAIVQHRDIDTTDFAIICHGKAMST
ncbi:conserved unknown protein [Ectocarpus siliculosus]|uniref:Metallo-beta-lactamase domain-containing protein n=1 Tax=Ectocarpus siliculosus TaxID=2880 RepID=D7FYI0_ECTSI|nr:conserved unknown protein [Ectocarpus siliculosus]|eukprot:CBJ32522.1 conserved unknown protein [Ectocarpus siliculosus]